MNCEMGALEMDCPHILLSTSGDGGEHYSSAICSAGGRASGGYCPPIDAGYDGLLLCGGDDIDPSYFGEKDDGSQGIDPARDTAELALIEAYLAVGKPIFGICRGHQVLNVALGGSLLQDIGPSYNLFHRHAPGTDHANVHSVHAAEGSLLQQFYGQVFLVNSSHHQAVHRLGEGLHATAWSESGLIEALEHETRPILTVQFHPERMGPSVGRPSTVEGARLFQWFVLKCQEPR